MDRKIADELLVETRENYDGFAESFSRTRNRIWPEMVSLASGRFNAGDKVLDIGCGNGRYYQFFNERGADYCGVDNSKNLIAASVKKFPEAKFIVADALSLPFADNEFDMAVSVAVLHHISSKEYRKRFFEEAWRVLKPGGCLIVVVWDLRPLSMIKTKQWKRLKSFLKSQINIALGRQNFDAGDFFIPWQNNYQRYVHSFTIGGLKKIVASGDFKIEKSGVAGLGMKEGNLYIIAKKCEKKNGF